MYLIKSIIIFMVPYRRKSTKYRTDDWIYLSDTFCRPNLPHSLNRFKWQKRAQDFNL